VIAQRLIEDARAAGLSMEVEGGDLIVEADRDPPPSLLAELRQHKAEVIALLRSQTQETVGAGQEVDDLDERAAIIEEAANVPKRWAEGYAALSSMPGPAGFLPERWARIIDAAGVFIDKWAAKAIACGWTDIDIFGCDGAAPDRRFDCMGLIMLVDHFEMVAIDPAGADLRALTGGALQRYRRKPKPDHTVRLWDLATAGRDAG
jgi:hypothetical protein